MQLVLQYMSVPIIFFCAIVVLILPKNCTWDWCGACFLVKKYVPPILRIQKMGQHFLVDIHNITSTHQGRLDAKIRSILYLLHFQPSRRHSMTTWTQFCSFFDHLATSTWTFLTLNVDKNMHFWTNYPPYLAHVVIERFLTK